MQNESRHVLNSLFLAKGSLDVSGAYRNIECYNGMHRTNPIASPIMVRCVCVSKTFGLKMRKYAIIMCASEAAYRYVEALSKAIMFIAC